MNWTIVIVWFMKHLYVSFQIEGFGEIFATVITIKIQSLFPEEILVQY